MEKNTHVYVLFHKIALVYDVSVRLVLAVCLVDSPPAGAQVKQSHVEQKETVKWDSRVTQAIWTFNEEHLLFAAVRK